MKISGIQEKRTQKMHSLKDISFREKIATNANSMERERKALFFLLKNKSQGNER
jgi:hypothetical protein